MTDKPSILHMNQLTADQQSVVDVLRQALEQAELGNIDTVGVVACMKGGYAAVMGGSRAGDLSLGCFDLMNQILQATHAGAAIRKRSIIRPGRA